MWKANHRFWCLDPSRYRVVEITQQIHKEDGDYVDDGHLNPQQVTAQCLACGAEAKWIADKPGEDQPKAGNSRGRKPR